MKNVFFCLSSLFLFNNLIYAATIDQFECEFKIKNLTTNQTTFTKQILTGVRKQVANVSLFVTGTESIISSNLQIGDSHGITFQYQYYFQQESTDHNPMIGYRDCVKARFESCLDNGSMTNCNVTDGRECSQPLWGDFGGWTETTSFEGVPLFPASAQTFVKSETINNHHYNIACRYLNTLH